MKSVSALILVSAFGVVACGGSPPSLKIVPSKMTATFDPNAMNSVLSSPSCIKLTITGSVNGEPLTSQTVPIIQTTLGVLIDPGIDLTQGNVMQSPTPVGGTATLYLCSAIMPGTALVTGTVTDAYSVNANASVSIVFTPAEVGNQIGSLTFSCLSTNIDAFADSAFNLAMGCNAVAQDKTGAELPNANILFMAEAGTVQPSTNASATNLPLYTYLPHQGKHVQPLDVAPLMGEPSWTDSIKGVTHNPRDGLTTLVAYVKGNNSPTGDIFGGDPFVDANDNGQYDIGEDFFDAAGTGAYAATQSAYVWTQFQIVWSGAPSLNPKVATITTTPSALTPMKLGAKLTANFVIVDDNYNPIACNDQSADSLSWQLMPEGSGGLYPSGSLQAAMKNSMGINIDPTTQKIRSPTSATSYEIYTSYSLEVSNDRAPMDGMAASIPWQIGAQLNCTGVLDDMGNSSSQQTYILGTVNGSLLDM